MIWYSYSKSIYYVQLSAIWRYQDKKGLLKKWRNVCSLNLSSRRSVIPCIRPQSSLRRSEANADLWRKSDSSEELKGSQQPLASNQSDWPLSPLMAASTAPASSELMSASDPTLPTSIVVIPSVSRNVVGEPRNGGHQRHWWSL